MQAALATRVRSLGLADYLPLVAEMRDFTLRRSTETPDEIWVLEHPPVYTLGQGADPRFGPKIASGVPVVQAERGGEITYHGPGQAVLYTLVDIARRGIKVKEFLRLLEQCAIDPCGYPGLRVAQARDFGIEGSAREVGLRLARLVAEGLEHA